MIYLSFKTYFVLPLFSGVHVAQSLVFCVVFCRSLFVFSGVHVAQSLVFCVVFCRSLFVFSVVCVTRSLVFCVVFCRSLFVLLFFFACIVCPFSNVTNIRQNDHVNVGLHWRHNTGTVWCCLSNNSLELHLWLIYQFIYLA